MPEDSNKNSQKKGKNDPKEQRKPRQARQNKQPVEKKIEKPNEASNVTAPEKPAVEEPGPEFYKNLKRETDEILKITEEANSKYNKKEIQSNWKKYEIPIETYDEIEEQENMGADYEKLIQIPMSAGGHFQFKHEKSWDSANAPSEYDKYFNIDMDNLTIALCTIPFYERNNIDVSIFSAMDIKSMENRATKYKQKYYNDRSFTTPELEASDRKLNTLKETLTTSSDTDSTGDKLVIDIDKNIEEKIMSSIKDLQHDSKSDEMESNEELKPIRNTALENKNAVIDDDIDDILGTLEMSKKSDLVIGNETNIKKDIYSEKEVKINTPVIAEESKVASASVEDAKKPVIESPEDLEKWLDDFLDS